MGKGKRVGLRAVVTWIHGSACPFRPAAAVPLEKVGARVAGECGTIIRQAILIFDAGVGIGSLPAAFAIKGALTVRAFKSSEPTKTCHVAVHRS